MIESGGPDEKLQGEGASPLGAPIKNSEKIGYRKREGLVL
jgi:hypothetical protein